MLSMENNVINDFWIMKNHLKLTRILENMKIYNKYSILTYISILLNKLFIIIKITFSYFTNKNVPLKKNYSHYY